MDVDRAVGLIIAGSTGAEAAHAIGVPWPSLSSALQARGLSSKALKASRDIRRIRALIDRGLSAEDIRATLGISAVVFRRLTKRGGLEYVTAQQQEQRATRERVRALYGEGVPAGKIAEQMDMKVSSLYIHLDGLPRQHRNKGRRAQPVQTPKAPRTARMHTVPIQGPRRVPSVRQLYDKGQSLRLICERLQIDLDTARRRLRDSFPDTEDRPINHGAIQRQRETLARKWAETVPA